MLSFPRLRRRSIALLTAVTAVATACGRTAPTSRSALEPVYDATTGELTLLRHDADHDGVVETQSHMRGTRIVRIDVDTDEDGRVDRWEHYGADQRLEKVGFSRAGDGREDAWSFADASGAIIRIESAAPGSSRISRTEHYEHAVLVRAEEDSDSDGHVDRWERYDGGRLVSLAFDADHGGQATTLITYQADGSALVETLKPDLARRR